MSNPLVTQVPIQLDKERRLLFTTQSLIELEKATGLNALDGSISQVFKNLSVERTCLLLWAGLVHEDENLTLKQVIKLVSPTDIATFIEKIVEAWKASMPEKKSDEEAEKVPLQVSAQP
jgi:hypothetical protein